MKSNRENVMSWLESTGRLFGQKFVLDENGICVIENNQGIQCVIEVPKDDSHFVYFYSLVADIPKTNKEYFFEQLLVKNLYGLNTNVATLAIDPEINAIILYYAFHISTSNSAFFAATLNSFVGTTVKIKEEIEEILVKLNKNELQSINKSSSQFVFSYPQLKA